MRHRAGRNALVVVRIWPAVVAGAVLVACGPDTAPAPPQASAAPVGTLESNAVVGDVVDGDTIDVVIDGREDRVRLTGIDTPEIAHAASGTRPETFGECFGDEAAAYTASLLPVGAQVRLERDVVGRDDYGRILAYVYRADDGIFVNYEIVRQGYAQPLSIPPNTTFAELMVDAARAAEVDDVGLWSACR